MGGFLLPDKWRDEDDVTEMIHCDLDGCEQTRRSDRTPVLPDPWLTVAPFDDFAPSVPETRHYCCPEHAAEDLGSDLSRSA